MEDETLAPSDPVAGAGDDESAAQRQAEIDKLRSERAHLQSDLDAAIAQVGMLRAAVEELQGSKGSLESQILTLRETLSALHAEREEEAARADSDRRALEAVAARAADLEGDVSHLQNDLIAAESEGAEAIAEVKRLSESVQKLQGEVTELEAKLSETNKAENVLKLSVQRLAGEKNALEEKNGLAEAQIAVLEGKGESLERELERVSKEKEDELRNVKLAMAELEQKKTREVENGEKADVADGAEPAVDEGRAPEGVRFTWKMVAASTGAAAAVAVVACYLHHAKSGST